MAAMAQRDMESRKIEVDRKELHEVLVKNRDQHVKEYNEAVAGYKTTLRDKVNEAFVSAIDKLANQRDKIIGKIEALTEDKIGQQHSRWTAVEAIYVEMPVPRSYEEEYNAAIDMAKHDVRETLELTYAEFNCFFRDKWDWSIETKAINASYSNLR